jgi:predicted nucleotidyltransferase
MSGVQDRSTHIISVGTQVVARIDVELFGRQPLPRGSVGEVLQSPSDNSHSYKVRFAGGAEAFLRRREIAVLREYQSPDSFRGAESPVAEFELDKYIIYRCVMGSRAYGLDGPDSDTDRRGIYLPPADMQWSLYGVPEQLENDLSQECYWELQKFLTLALKANPNVLECLFSPLVEHLTPISEELISIRSIFLSRLVYQTYNGYVMSQFKKIERRLKNQGDIKWKHAMHLVRILLSGIRVLREGYVPVQVGDDRDKLMAIRRGDMLWSEIDAWRQLLHREFDGAFQTTKLPERPDYAKANAFLVRARRAMV